MAAEQSGPAWWDAELVPPPSDIDVARGFLRALQYRLAASARVGADEDPLAEVKAGILARQRAEPASVLNEDEHGPLRREASARLAVLDIGRDVGGASEGLEQVLQDLLNEITADADTAADSAAIRMAVGLLPIEALDAITLGVPGEAGAYLLVMNEQVPTYVNLLAKACAQLLPVRRSDQDVSIDLENPEWTTRLEIQVPGVQRFLELMFAALGGRPSDAEQYWPESDWQAPAEALREAGEAFLLARQYMHLVLDHNTPGAVDDVFVKGERLQVLRFTREQDSDADIEALRLLLRIPRFGDHAALTCWAVDTLLASLAMLESLRARDAEPDADQGRLAPEDTWAGERRERLRIAIDDEAESRPGLAEVIEALDPVSRALWVHLKGLVLQRDS